MGLPTMSLRPRTTASAPSIWILLRRRIEHRIAFGRFGRLAQGHLQNFGEVEGVAIGLLSNLLAATKTIGDNEPVGWSFADCGQQFEFADGFRDVVFFFLEAERSRHAAAAGSGRGEVDPHAAEHRLLGGHLHDRLVVAMAMDKSTARKSGKRKGIVIRALLEKFAEQEDLLRESLGAFIFREKVGEFVAKDGRAARFEDNDWGGGFDFGEKFVHDLEEQAFGAIKHADVV